MKSLFFRIRNICYNPNTSDTNCKQYIFYKKKQFLKIIDVQNQLPLRFGISLIYIKILKFRNPNPLPHTKFLPFITCYTSNENNIEINIDRLFKLSRFIATIDFT